MLLEKRKEYENKNHPAGVSLQKTQFNQSGSPHRSISLAKSDRILQLDSSIAKPVPVPSAPPKQFTVFLSLFSIIWARATMKISSER